MTDDDPRKLRLVAEIDKEAQAIEVMRKDTDKYAHSARRLNATERRSRILSMARNGATTQQIADVIARGDPERGIPGHSMDKSDVSRMIRRYLEEVHREDTLTVEQMRVMENERIDALWTQLAAQVRNIDGSVNLKVVDRMTRLSERRAKMNGLDAAQKHEHFIGNGLAALGLEEEHVSRARQAFADTFLNAGIQDVIVPGEAEEIEDVE